MSGPRRGWLASIGVAAAILGVGCGADEVELVGQRADGITVTCSDEGDDQYGCDPDVPEESGGADDPCTDWTAGGAALVLWPPNHKTVTVTLEDCAAARPLCDASQAVATNGRIVSVTSDEALDAEGDGRTTGDLAISGPREVTLRSERQGGGDGRVYRIESVDDDGHHDLCEVHVPHDMGPYGGAIDSGEAVRVDASP